MTQLPENMFQNFTFSRVHITDVVNLTAIHADAFSSSSQGIQVLEISEANFTLATSSGTEDIFRAVKSLTNLRILRLHSCGLAFVPAHYGDSKLSKQLRDLHHAGQEKTYIWRGKNWQLRFLPKSAKLRPTQKLHQSLCTFCLCV